MRRRLVFIAPLAIIGLLLFIALGGMVVQLLWNWLMPSIFDVRQITWWQAVGLLALTRILFGGFGRHGCGRSGMRRRIEERWGRMTPEERERFRAGMRARWGFGPPPPGEHPGQ